MNQCDGCQAGMSLLGGLHLDGKSKFVRTANDYQKRPYNTKTKRRTYTVTDEVHAELHRLGQGNASRGIREAVKAAQVRTLEQPKQ